MKKLFFLIGICFVATTVYAKSIQLMVFGDSLSAGYSVPANDAFYMQLQRSLDADGYDVTVLNFSKSGETTVGGAAKIKQALQLNPDAVLLELGINDMLHGLSLNNATKNLQSIIDAFQQKNIPILLIGMEAPARTPLTYRTTFRQMYRSLAETNNIMLYPFFMDGLWNEDGTHKSPSYFLSDKAHPSASGITIITKNITPTIEKFLDKHFIQRR